MPHRMLDTKMQPEQRLKNNISRSIIALRRLASIVSGDYVVIPAYLAGAVVPFVRDGDEKI